MRCIYIAERLFGLNIKVYWNKIESIIKNTKSVITGYSFEYINKKSNILIQVWHHLCGTVTDMKLNVEYWIILSEIFYTFPSMLNMPFFKGISSKSETFESWQFLELNSFSIISI